MHSLFLKNIISQKNDPPEAAPPTDAELMFHETAFFPPKNDPPEAAPPTNGELIFKKPSFFKNTTRRRQRRQRMESLLPRDLLSITPRLIIDCPATYFDYPAAYYRLPHALLSIMP